MECRLPFRAVLPRGTAGSDQVVELTADHAVEESGELVAGEDEDGPIGILRVPDPDCVGDLGNLDALAVLLCPRALASDGAAEVGHTSSLAASSISFTESSGLRAIARMRSNARQAASTSVPVSG